MREKTGAPGAGDRTVLSRVYGLQDSVGPDRTQPEQRAAEFAARLTTAKKGDRLEALHTTLESERRRFLPTSPKRNGATPSGLERLLRFNEVAAMLESAPLTPIGGGDLEIGTLLVPAGPWADSLRHIARVHFLAAYTVQGMQAFENTQGAAALHEAGHCVVNQSEGVTPAKVRIWLNEGDWVGRTEQPTRLRTDNTTTPGEDLCHARITYAGLLSEQLFDADYRLASSIDEFVLTMVLVRNAAIKLRRDPEELLCDTRLTVGVTLVKHEGIVRRIAEELMRERNIDAEKLAQLLSKVEVRYAR
jgi:hypothetical protein